MVYSLWEILRFSPEELRERLHTKTFEQREEGRLEALCKADRRIETQEKEDTK
jgi:hypothetical protein